MLVGLSLSFCVADIIHDKVAETDVVCILSGCNWPDDEWDERVEHYVDVYWWENRDRARKIVERLRKTGRIIQPAAIGQEPCNIAAGWWVDLTKDSVKERR